MPFLLKTSGEWSSDVRPARGFFRARIVNFSTPISTTPLHTPVISLSASKSSSVRLKMNPHLRVIGMILHAPCNPNAEEPIDVPDCVHKGSFSRCHLMPYESTASLQFLNPFLQLCEALHHPKWYLHFSVVLWGSSAFVNHGHRHWLTPIINGSCGRFSSGR